jgi:hypothetical protein
VPEQKFLFLGDWYPLTVEETDQGPPLKLWSGRFFLMGRHIGDARGIFIRWYQKEAKERISDRSIFFRDRLSLHPKGIKITNAKHRWGSCTRSDLLCFSWRIIMAPLPVIDYVLVHELVHIKEKNHSKRFWGYLESILPDYRKRRRWLKENGHLLQI